MSISAVAWYKKRLNPCHHAQLVSAGADKMEEEELAVTGKERMLQMVFYLIRAAFLYLPENRL